MKINQPHANTGIAIMQSSLHGALQDGPAMCGWSNTIWA